MKLFLCESLNKAEDLMDQLALDKNVWYPACYDSSMAGKMFSDLCVIPPANGLTEKQREFVAKVVMSRIVVDNY